MIRFSLLIIFILSSCVTNHSAKEKKILLSDFDKILIGESTNKIKALIGEPARKIPGKKHENAEDWLYERKDEYKSQIASLLVDTNNNTVTSILLVPDSEDPEFKIHYLFNTKYSGIPFDKIRLKKCKRHYFPSEVFYINEKEGLVISGDLNNDGVSYYTRATPNFVRQFIKQINNCKI